MTMPDIYFHNRLHPTIMFIMQSYLLELEFNASICMSQMVSLKLIEIQKLRNGIDIGSPYFQIYSFSKYIYHHF